MTTPPDVEPKLLPVPSEVSGYLVRLELSDTEPAVWRRLALPGDLTLSRLHDVIQAAMGWSDSHLHRFRLGRDRQSPSFVTILDLEEGDDGVLEDDVRLDQLVAGVGAELWYEYDFGDGWDHQLRVEDVIVKPARILCAGGELACPPEDRGGVDGYDELARWVRSGYDDALLPSSLDDAADGREWLPAGWDPDRFVLDEANAAIAATA